MAKALIETLEAILPNLGTLPLSEEWCAAAIRHCQRNEDIEFSDGGNEPDRYAGVHLARLANNLPAILSALRQAGGVERMREALEWYAEQVSDCRKISSPGDPARSKLSKDGGSRARQALEGNPDE
jgi:hypothetical protein